MEPNRTVAIGIASSVASLAIGATAGYFYAKRKLKRKYEEYADQQIAEARRKLKMLYKQGEFSKPPTAAPDDAEDDLLPIMDEAVTAILTPVLAKYDPPRQFTVPHQNNGHTVPSNDEDEAPLETSREEHWNVFERQLNMADDTEEQYPVPEPRIEGKPYVISTAEFNADDRGYQQVTLTSYADGALVQEGDPSEEMLVIEDVIGPNALKYFGWDPDEPNVVHVRNDRLRIDYEVIKDERRFGIDMLGLAPGNPLLEAIEEMQEQHRRAAASDGSPKAPYSNYRPGGVVGAG